MLPDETTRPATIVRVEAWRDRLRYGLVGVLAVLTFRKSSWHRTLGLYLLGFVLLPGFVASGPLIKGWPMWEIAGLVVGAALLAPAFTVLYGAVSSMKPGRRVYSDVRRTAHLQIDISEAKSLWKFSGHVKVGRVDAQVLRRDVLEWLLPQATRAGATVKLTAAHWKLAKKYSADLRAAEAGPGTTPGDLDVRPSGKIEMLWTPPPLVSPRTPSATPQAGSLAG